MSAANNKNKVLLIGADGQLGTDIIRIFDKENIFKVISATIHDLDITRAEQVDTMFQKHQPDIVINTASYIQVDLSEDEPEIAFEVNAVAVKNLCDACKENDTILLHLSTDYVFAGHASKPYHEEECARPEGIYGISKLAGELIIQYQMQNYFIARVSGLYGHAGPMGKRANFVDIIHQKALHKEPLRVVDDQRLTPTYTLDCSKAIHDLLTTNHFGTYHLTSSGDCTWYEFAQEICAQCGLETDIQKAKTGDFGEKAKRPAYSVLENQKLKESGLPEMPNWKDALHRYLIEKGYIDS